MPPDIVSDIDPEFTLEKAQKAFLDYQRKKNQRKVKFALDHHPHANGEGIIVEESNTQYIVLLTTDCKELKFGSRIIVDKDEVYEKNF